MNRSNLDLRIKLQAHGICLWVLAAQIGIHPTTLSTWLRFPLEGERKERVETALSECIASHTGGCE